MPKESDHATSGKLEEKTKQVESLQSKLKDLEDQNRDLQKNVCAYILQYIALCCMCSTDYCMCYIHTYVKFLHDLNNV